LKKSDHIAVIGAGLAGLTVARALADRGHNVVVFYKGRGLGGRMASRRKNGWRFDHGAIALRPSEDDFVELMRKTEAAGHAADWEDGGGWTGLPGVSSIVKPIADGLTIHRQSEITGLERSAERWILKGVSEAADTQFDSLVLAIPQPQALRLLSPWPEAQARIAPVQMDPCWTLMAGFDAPLAAELTYAKLEVGPIAVIARETGKPGRDLPGDGWVIQASPEWSTTHLEWDPTEVTPVLLDAFFTQPGCRPVTPAISMAHRWRFALTSCPLGQAYLHDTSLSLSICGDWCLGHTAQDAFNSGRGLAAALLVD